MENTAASCTIIRNGRKSSRQIIGRPFRSARIAEKTFSRNGVPAHSAASAATLAVSSGGQSTGKQIHPWRKSPCGANAAGRRCAQIRKSIADVPAISEPWKKRTASRYARGAEKNFRSMQGKNVSIAAGTAPMRQRLRPKNFQKGRRRLRNTEPESWTEHIKQAAREAELDRDSKRVRLVCGETSMYAGIDSLSAIIRYRLRFNPYDGSIYVFRDQSGTMLKYLHWDGQSFCQGKRRAQSGTYPWPDAPEGEIVEITEREFQYLLSRSIVPIKDRK